jgi:hypothetical protein
MTARPTTRWLQFKRRMALDGNPLRRRSDVIAAWLTPAFILLFAALIPVVAVMTNTLARDQNAAVVRASHTWTHVTGTLLRSAPGPAQRDHGANVWSEVVPAKWSFDGVQHTGSVPVPAGSRVGSSQTVNLNAAGQVMTPPLAPTQLAARIDTLTFIVMAALALLLMTIKGIVGRILDKRRLAAWASDWLAVAARWSQHQG